MKRLIFMMIFSALTGIVVGQINDNRRCRWVKGNEALLQPTDTSGLVIDPSSFIIRTPGSLQVEYTWDSRTNKLLIRSEIELPDSVEVCYRVIGIETRPLFSRTLNEYDSTAHFKDYERIKNPLITKREQLFETGDVNTSGRLSRGFTLGTNQDLFVNSSLNLVMDGKLTDDLFIQASITDQNIPFQPEGSTAQLQDFDNVYMKLYNDRFSVTGGDIVLSSQPSRFLKYYKNVQGVLFGSNSARSRTTIGASIAKGKFATIKIASIEGILGPYRIPGPDGSDFVIVLANSEKIYLDGIRLKRGFDLDYTIDYNLGEIIFTSRITITKFSRIRVDYEYADNRYSRSVLAVSHSAEINKWTLFVNAYSEKDNKNRPNFDLRDEDKLLLSSVGDNLDSAFRSGADSVGYDTKRILYKKIIIDNNEVYVHSTHPDSAFWEVKFTKAGLNKGNYVQKVTTANGKVFEWVIPAGGVPQGEYVPFKIIPAPSKKQMVDAGASYQINEYERIKAEVSFSDSDKNLFSDANHNDNAGSAINFMVESAGRKIGGSAYTLNSMAEIEYLSKNFTPIDRFRRVEFDRDWSYQPDEKDDPSDDLLITMVIGAKKDAYNLLDYTLSHRKKGYLVSGFQNTLNFNKEFGNARLISKIFLSDNDQAGIRSGWQKIYADLSYGIGKIRPGYALHIEEQEEYRADSLINSTNHFTEHVIYLRSLESEKSYFGLDYSLRNDREPYQGEIVESNQSQTVNLTYRNSISRFQNISVLLSYRNLQNKGEGVDFGSGESLKGRIDWYVSFFNNLFKNELTYSISNSRELKKEFVYIQVPTGQGSYTWMDQNGDGIQDLNEFFLAVNIDEKNYAKIFIPGGDYIDAFENTFNYRLNFSFPHSWRKSGGIKRLLNKISNSTVWNSISKITDKSLNSRLLAFIKPLDREEVLSIRENFRTTWFFNRGSPSYGINAGYNQFRYLNLLTGGFEDRLNKEFSFTGRMNAGRAYSVKLTASYAKEFSESDFLDDRNFIISANSVRPTFSWQPRPYFRMNVIYGIRSRSNVVDPEQGESAWINELAGEFKFTKISKTNFQGILKFSKVDFAGDMNTPAGFAVLAGLNPGANINWSLNWQQTLIEGLQMSVIYSGRKSENTRVINFGSITVHALF